MLSPGVWGLLIHLRAKAKLWATFSGLRLAWQVGFKKVELGLILGMA